MVLTNKVGITGSSGLLGKHVINFFLKKGCKIISTSRKKPNIFHKNFFWKKLDLGKRINEEKLEKIFKNINCLIHVRLMFQKSMKKKQLNTLTK